MVALKLRCCWQWISCLRQAQLLQLLRQDMILRYFGARKRALGLYLSAISCGWSSETPFVSEKLFSESMGRAVQVFQDHELRKLRETTTAR